MTKRSKAAERIGTAFQRLIPRMILLHEQVAKDAGISGSTRRRTPSRTLQRCALGSASISRRISFTLMAKQYHSCSKGQRLKSS